MPVVMLKKYIQKVSTDIHNPDKNKFQCLLLIYEFLCTQPASTPKKNKNILS